MAANAFQPVLPTREPSAGLRLHPLIENLIVQIAGASNFTEMGAPPVDPLKALRELSDALNDATHHSVPTAKGPVQPNAPPVYTPLAEEIRSALPTVEAAYHLNRAQQTLRLWSMRDDGPLRPMRINGRLAWSVAEIRKLLKMQA
jgi:hypothetical protein